MEYQRLQHIQLDQHLNPIARAILQGVNDENSPFSKLNGIPHVLQMIWRYIITTMKQHIKFEPSWIDYLEDPVDPSIGVCGYIECEPISISFPESTDININMMPFIMEQEFEKTKLPEYLRKYFETFLSPLISEYEEMGKEIDKICYLTIHESLVEEGKSQRRPGLHTESPGIIYVKNGMKSEKIRELCIEKGSGRGDTEIPWVVCWGGQYGMHGEVFTPSGGIYMASNVPNSCEVWDCQIVANDKGEEIIGKFGNIEHLRGLLSGSKIMKSDKLYWITDRTPHESLPLKKGTYRQFFRLVTQRVSVWYEDHSTKNPNGVVPDPKITRILRGSKFDEDSVAIVG